MNSINLTSHYIRIVNFAVLCLTAYTDSDIAVSLTVSDALLMDNINLQWNLLFKNRQNVELNIWNILHHIVACLYHLNEQLL